MSWLDRLRGGFAKTAERVTDNLTGLTTRAPSPVHPRGTVPGRLATIRIEYAGAR